MSKLLLLAIIVLIIVGVFTGVFEVKVHLDKLGSVPATLQQAVGGGAFFPQAEYQVTIWMRKAEIALTSSESKKFEHFMKFVERDTKRLKETLDASNDPEIIVMHSDLLKESVESAKESIDKLSDADLQKVRDSWVKILASANIELARLAVLAQEYKEFQEKIEKNAPLPAGVAGEPEVSPKIELKF